MMTGKPPRLCSRCRRIHPTTQRCAQEIAADRERKARHDQRRPSARARGYNTAWDKARATFLVTNPWCVDCGAKATTVDHKVPHRGDDRLFWDRANWQPLCTRCHSSHKQRLERAEARP